ncbi:MAG: Lrp/AsnC family transcriptional regulator [Deltaproteobacteria bacterium]|nr:Lrp/AsnC family transcriptional regulator [Deltaproteobacteria bacterium]
MTVVAYILINTELDSEDETLEKLGCTPNVREIHTVYGVYDIIIRVECETMEKLKETVNDIRRLETVQIHPSTDMHMSPQP